MSCGIKYLCAVAIKSPPKKVSKSQHPSWKSQHRHRIVVVAEDGCGNGAAGFVDMESGAKNVVFGWIGLQVADGAGGGAAGCSLIGSVGAIRHVFPLAVAVDAVVDTEAFLLAHDEQGRGCVRVLLK